MLQCYTGREIGGKNMSESKVMRLNESEIDLIEFIRNSRVIDISKSMIEARVSIGDHLSGESTLLKRLNVIFDAINSEKKFNTNYFTEREKLAEITADIIEHDKNIIITGPIAVGKTTLLFNILKYQDLTNYNLISSEDCEIKLISPDINFISSIEDIDYYIDEVKNNGKKNIFIKPELRTIDDLYQVIHCLNLGIIVYVTMYGTPGQSYKECIELISSRNKPIEYKNPIVSDFIKKDYFSEVYIQRTKKNELTLKYKK